MLFSQLKTLIAIQKGGSFSAAAKIVHRSHSAISIQMRQLEDQTGLRLFEKGKRPATLTPVGRQFLLKSQEILDHVAELDQIGKEDSTSGAISIGFVPTTLQTVLPIALAALRSRYPDLHVSVVSGLSGELSQAVADQTLDFAFLTAPTISQADIQITTIAEEPLAIISDLNCKIPRNPYDLFLSHAFIAFSRKSWLGQQIETNLAQAGVSFDPTIELDNINAVENLVALGHGVSVVPIRTMAPAHPGLRYTVPSDNLLSARRLTLASHLQSPRKTLRDVIVEIVIQNINSAANPST
ncbi:MAG: LysR family transcriptional regulator [Proteobacteria bacterium]|nr:LysR family transcriptional regulator [Pseudomonadota bacterium]